MAQGPISPRTGEAEALPPAVAASQFTAVVIVLATLGWTVWLITSSNLAGAIASRGLATAELVTAGVRSLPDYRVFASAIATPVGFAALVLVRTEALRSAGPGRIGTLAGLIVGAAVAVAGLVTAMWSATEGDSGGFWAFLAGSAAPVGVGGALFVSAAALRNPRWARRLGPYAAGMAIVLMAITIALGVRAASEATDNPGPVFLLATVWPAGVSVLLLVMSAELDGRAWIVRWGAWLGSLIGALGVAAAVWIALDIYSDYRDSIFGPTWDTYLWTALQVALLPMVIGSLAAVTGLGLKGRSAWEGAPTLGRTLAIVMGVGAMSLAMKLSAVAEVSGFWTFIGVLLIPLALVASIVVGAERCERKV